MKIYQKTYSFSILSSNSFRAILGEPTIAWFKTLRARQDAFRTACVEITRWRPEFCIGTICLVFFAVGSRQFQSVTKCHDLTDFLFEPLFSIAGLGLHGMEAEQRDREFKRFLKSPFNTSRRSHVQNCSNGSKNSFCISICMG